MSKLNLEEAAKKYVASIIYEHGLYGGDFLMPVCEDIFKAGAEWQKEQDQPITGNSLEQEWLRYVDRKKKECGGELPALGEYGWLQIARHFAEWQKKQIPMPEDTVLFNKGVAEGKRLMLEDAVEYEVIDFSPSLEPHPHVNIHLDNKKYRPGDTVRVIVLPKED